MNLLRAPSIHTYMYTDQAQQQSAAKSLIVLGAFKSFAMREIHLIPTLQFTLVTIVIIIACSLVIHYIHTHRHTQTAYAHILHSVKESRIP